ncbi:MAG: nitric oxide synthase [Devosia sp.]|uniref:PepSY domain-containing protein n=1 Tax=Devosia sp. TaxID=1871048 RepID=UPI00262AEFA0|nr:PepSY domain-containing protein [Devosia sp.]MDB5529953.1 nitric oxide synthase [Devosia sp.]
MLRRLHSLPALIAALVVSFMALTGAFLSLDPAIQHFAASGTQTAGVNAAELASSVAANFPGVERIVKLASGSVIAYYSDGAGQVAATIDPQTGNSLGAYAPSPVFGFMTELHRSLFLGEGGRAVAGIGAFALVILSISGGLLLVARLGGWAKVFSAARGTFTQRLHVDIGRIAIAALLLTATTGTYMSLVNFGFISDGSGALAAFPTNVDGGKPAAIADLAALRATPLGDLRELVFPFRGDPTDVFTLTTNAGQGFVDQATGTMLSFTANNFGQSVYEAFYTLHTGQGVWWLGLLLGAAALCVPVMAASGTVIWWLRRRNLPKLNRNVAARAADTVILVGSEGNSTWGYAAALHEALTQAGHRVHTSAMNGIARDYGRARQMFILTATYGDGGPPASANRFLARLAKLETPALSFAVLGFGDRSFAHYCQFAADVETALVARGWSPFQPVGTIDRQSSQTFAQWGAATAARIGTQLHLVHTPARPRTTDLTLLTRVDYGVEVQAPTTVLRFGVAESARGGLFGLLGGRRLLRFEAGDLVGILPPGSSIPRYYSLASSSRQGFLEICVRKLQGGACSEYLHALAPGSTIEAFVKPNPNFRPASGRTPVIMIGAGTGIAPLAGFIQGNTRHRPMHLYFGGRDPHSDFLYEDAMAAWLEDTRLTRLVTAFSRIVDGAYVQDRVREDAEQIRTLVARGAQIMVCGGIDMARGAREAIDEIISPLGENALTLKAKGRYLEDVY